MAKKKDKRRRRPEQPPPVEYTDEEGNVLRLRQALSPGTIAKIGEPPTSAAASLDDAWQRRYELLFERLTVSWDIAGLPLTDQKMLLGRYRMASAEERRWVQRTLSRHVERYLPELAP